MIAGRRKIPTGLIISTLMLFLLSSCVHQSPYKDEYYYQALGGPGEVVVTIDAPRASSVIDLSQGAGLPFLSLLDRIDRISFSLYPASEDENTEGSFQVYGGMEGNIPSFLTNTVFLYDDSFTKVEEDGIRYYRNEYLGMDLYSPKSGLLLFASDDYLRAYRQSYKERDLKIERSLAERMGSALFGFHAEGSQNMIDIGLEIPESVLAKTTSMTVVFDTDDQERIVLGAIIRMESDSLAKSLSILLKSKYISEKRRNREPLGDLTGLFELDGVSVTINGMYMSDEQIDEVLKLFSQVITNQIGGA